MDGLSIIVSAYNAEKYIERCIKSIMDNENFSDAELIIINDGSTDETKNIIGNITRNKDNIQVINQVNKGLVLSRRLGVQVSKYEYVTFIDADDWIEKDYLSRIFNIIMQHKPDICVLGCVNDYDNYSVEEVSSFEEGIYSKENTMIEDKLIYDFLMKKKGVNASIWGKAIRKELYVRFADRINPEITLGEDGVIVYPMLCCAKSIYISYYCGYHYIRHMDSMLNNTSINSLNKIKLLKENMKSIFSELELYDRMQEQINWYCDGFIKDIIYREFDISLTERSLCLPYDIITRSDKIVVYGAGKIGKLYIKELILLNLMEKVIWIDKNVNGKIYGIEIHNIMHLQQIDYDYILIAIGNKNIAESIVEDLIKLGVDKSKIKWSPVRWR